MRALVACHACRSRRRKCETQRGSSTCVYCCLRGFSCAREVKVPKQHLAQHESISAPQSTHVLSSITETPLPQIELCIELVGLYFDLIHDQFHSLFHKPSFIEDVREGLAPKVIIFGMMALSARFSTNELFSSIAPRERTKLYFEQAANLLNLRDTSLTTIQACVLLGAISTTEDDAITESVYYTVACRMANLLDLPRRATSDSLEKEINLRVWWTLCMVDVWSSKSVRLPRQMPHLGDLALPIDEKIFLQQSRGSVIIYPGNYDRRSSLLAQMITLNRILLEINDVISQTAVSGTINVVVEHTIQDLSRKMDAWHRDLPSYMHDTHENLTRYSSQGLGRLFVAVYLGYYHFGQLLFYQFLDEDRHSSGKNYYANKCKDYSAKLCSIVYAAHATPGCEVWYNMVGHILVIASTIQIHTLLFSTDEAQIAAARSRLERNFEFLMRLRSFWPILESCFARLQVFHEVCRTNIDTSFRMDQWMLKFLSEFAEPVQAKENDKTVLGLYSVANVGVSPQDWV